MFNRQIAAMRIPGRGFPMGPPGKTASHYSDEFRSPISRWGLSGKLRPTLGRQNGTRFPVEASSGKRIPELALRLGCNFPIEPLGETATRNLRPKRDAVSPRTESAARPSSKSSVFLRCMRNIQGVSQSAGNRNVPSCRQHFTATAKTRAGNRSHLRGFSGRSQRYVTEAHVSYGLPNGTGTRCLSRLTKR